MLFPNTTLTTTHLPPVCAILEGTPDHLLRDVRPEDPLGDPVKVHRHDVRATDDRLDDRRAEVDAVGDDLTAFGDQQHSLYWV